MADKTTDESSSDSICDEPLSEHGLEVALAEFGALRDEILSIRSLQKNMIGIALTAYAAVFTVYADRQDERLLWVLPPIGLVLCLIQMGEAFQMTVVSVYLEKHVWPRLSTSGYVSRWETRSFTAEPPALARVLTTDGSSPRSSSLGAWHRSSSAAARGGW